ncbi:TRAP transporter large permease subunit [Acetonema longum]|nr:TRAP transporter large permease subunit [Acetonema longum]
MSIWSLLAYIAAIIFWSSWLKRNIGEAMVVGWVVVLLFGGSQFFDLLMKSIVFAAMQETVYAALAFVFMAFVMSKTGLVNRLVDILNSTLGRVAGGAGYISTLASALMGLISGSGSGSAASVGAVTIPWMVNSNWPRQLSATMVAGNAGLGIALPPCSSMFLILGLGVVAEKVTIGSLYIALLTAGLWTLLYRLILVRWFVFKYNIQPLPPAMIKSFSQTFREGWTSLLIFVGIIVPVGLTIGPVADYLTAIKSFGPKGLKSISIIVWIPVLISWIAIFEGRKYLPKTASGLYELVQSSAKRYVVVGATLFAAFAAGDVMTRLGLAKDMMAILQAMNLSPLLMIILVGILVTLIGGPLTSTATVVAIGSVSFSALIYAGVDPAIAAAVILIFSSTEGASPPGAAPIFIACGIANVDPVKTFVPLIVYYVIPIVIIGVLIALGVLPTMVM